MLKAYIFQYLLLIRTHEVRYMKILYIQLKNFASIKTAMKADSIKIDFSKCKNKIVLLTGANGSGKTSILSCLHPFATNGNLDIRSDQPLVEVGSEGYKEIHIEDDGNLYIIKHFYTPNKLTHIVKSYITKNGEELNPNGNVTSFKYIVKEELDIEPDYLKLARLGSNVTNFIDLKTTDRKNFMGKILEDLDVYLKYYKKVTNDMREVKSVISHTVDKLTKLGIGDVEELKKSHKEMEKKLKEKKKEMDDINGELSIVNHEISQYDEIAYLKMQKDEAEKAVIKADKVLEKMKRHGVGTDINQDKEGAITEVRKSIIAKTKEQGALQEKAKALQDKRRDALSKMDTYLAEDKEVKAELRSIANSINTLEQEEIIKQYKEKIEKRSKENNLVNFHPKYTKGEMENFYATLQRLQDMLLTTYEFGKKPIEKALEFLLSKKDINEYVAGNTKKVSNNKLQTYAEYVYGELERKLGKPSVTCKHPEGCPIKEFYDTLYDYATEIPDTTVEDETFVTYTRMAYQNLNHVFAELRNQKEFLDRCPKEIQDMFLLTIVEDNIKNLRMIYNKEIIYTALTQITEYDNQSMDLVNLNLHKEKLKLMRKSAGNAEYFEKKQEELNGNIETVKKEIDDLNEAIQENRDAYTTATMELDSLNEFIDSLEKHDELLKELETLSTAVKKVSELYDRKKTLLFKQESMHYEYTKLEHDVNTDAFRLQQYAILNDDLTKYNTKYDEMGLVKSALSAKEGIPLLYIQIYLKNIQDTANDLLDLVYDGDLALEDFNITADEFGIPFVTKGAEIGDVCYASQGEKSFISLALSFALIYQSISRYNVMLLDEIDSTLDTSNRVKFLRILEKQMDMIDGEQIFLISHNNMFNMYPVDIIDTKNKEDSDNKLANYIHIQIQ